MRISGKKQQWLDTYYTHIDSNNQEAYMAMFTDDARLIFANAEPVHGKAGVAAVLDNLLNSIEGIQHILHGAYEEDSGLVVFECDVIYTRKDHSKVNVRGTGFFVINDDGLCSDQRIVVDASQVFAA